MTVIETARLRLRPLAPADCSDAYVGWLNDPEVSRFLETRHAPQTPDTVRAFVEAVAASPDETLFGIFLLDDDRHVGNIKVGPIRRAHGLADVSLFVGDRGVWGQGIGTEAIGAVSRYVFEAMGLAKLSASMYAENVGSTAAFLKAGYRREGLRRAHYRLDGGRSDLVELGLLPSDLGERP